MKLETAFDDRRPLPLAPGADARVCVSHHTFVLRPTRFGSFPHLFACFAFLLSFLPVWLPATLPPTCDGPSHVYNALIARAVSLGQPQFASVFVLRHLPRSNFVTDWALGALGVQFGWVTGERIWLTVVLLAQFVAFYYVFRAFTPAWRTILAAYLAHNWFLWMGFYDFALSLAFFVVFVAALLAKPTRLLYGLLLAAALGLYATHFFTFFVAICAAVWVFAWRLTHRQMKWYSVSVLLLPAVLLVNEVFGPVVHGGIGWWGWRKVVKSVLGLFVGDSLMTFSWMGLLAGVAVMAIVWSGIYWYARAGRFSKDARRAWAPLLGLLLFVVSIVVPAQIGVGTHVAARLRILAELLIIMATADALTRLRILRPLRIPAVSIGLSAALLIQTSQMVTVARAISAEAGRLTALVSAAGVPAGDWISSRLGNVNKAAFRIVPYRHLADRAYTDARSRSLDNYEAAAGNFQVRWRSAPSGFIIKRGRDEWLVPGLPQVAGFGSDSVWIIHDTGYGIVVTDPLEQRAAHSLGGFTITQVKRRL